MTTAQPYRWLIHFASEYQSLRDHAIVAKARLRLVRLFFAIRAMNENRDWDSFHRARNLRTFRKVPRHVRQWSLDAINEVSEADADLHACESGIRYFTQQMLGCDPTEHAVGISQDAVGASKHRPPRPVPVGDVADVGPVR